MVETSLYLARLLGPALILFGLAVALNPARMGRIGAEFLQSDALLFTSGILASVSGLALILAHNVWVAGWPVLITILGWIALFAGAGRLLLPALMQRVGTGMLDRPVLIAVPGALMILLGLYLSYQGFTA